MSESTNSYYSPNRFSRDIRVPFIDIKQESTNLRASHFKLERSEPKHRLRKHAKP
jgi:hypothetical protein